MLWPLKIVTVLDGPWPKPPGAAADAAAAATIALVGLHAEWAASAGLEMRVMAVMTDRGLSATAG
jgi:hypothetical protein